MIMIIGTQYNDNSIMYNNNPSYNNKRMLITECIEFIDV